MAITNQTSSILVPIFTGENYDLLSVKMKTFFRSKTYGHYRRGIHYSRRHSTLTTAQKKELKENK